MNKENIIRGWLNIIIVLYSIYIIINGSYYIIILSGVITSTKFVMLILTVSMLAKIMVLFGLKAIDTAIVSFNKINNGYVSKDTMITTNNNQIKSENADLND
ncbi:MAG: hypothetical protein ACYCT7_00620 [bacterium]